MNEQADRVRHERLRRGWSVREASQAGGISNTYWGKFEDYRQALTPFVQSAVAKAFEWTEDWPSEAGEFSPSDASRWVPLERHVELAEKLETLTARVQELDAAVKRLSREGRRGAQ